MIYQQSLNQSRATCPFMRNYLIFGIICLSVSGIFFVSSIINYVAYLEDLAQYQLHISTCLNSPTCSGGRIPLFDLYMGTSIQHAIIGSILASIGVVLLVKDKKKIIVNH